MVKNLCQCSRCKKQHFDPWVKKIPWRRRWHPTLVFLPGKSHGQSPYGHTELDVTEQWSAHSPTPATACMDFSFTLVGFPSKPYNCLMCYVLVCACLLSISFPLKRTMHRITHTCSAWVVHSCPYNGAGHETDMQWFWMTEMFHFKVCEMGKAFAPVTWDLLCSYLGLLFREKKSQRGRVLWIKWMIY